MILDWLVDEGWIVLNWWLLATVAGATALPLVMRLLGGLPDRGYTLARPAGMLLIAFVFWLLASLGFLSNSAGSMLVAWLVVLTVSAYVWYRAGDGFDVRDWWRENRSVVIAAEVLFAVLLITWAIVRAHQNGLAGTEKPMDLAFMSASARTETYPPNDPWLSGYSISYYYFGYVMGAMMSTLSGVWTTTGYNMHIAMLFALTGLAVFGVVYNLVRSRARRPEPDGDGTFLDGVPRRGPAILVGLLGMVFVIWMGNLHTAVVQIPYRAHAVSEDYLEFWDVKYLNSYNGRTEPLNLLDPDQRNENWNWWFEASRVVTERDLDGNLVNEVINEFPQFSFLLADSHPHVMALPYVLLAIGLALNVLLMDRRPDWMRTIFYGLCVGALVFLNTWDSPIYIMTLVGADGLRRLRRESRLDLLDWLELLAFGAGLVGVTIVAYFPFLAGFRSQLGGVLPNVLHPTRFQQLYLVFGPFFVLLGMFLGVEMWRARRGGRYNLSLGIKVALATLVVLLFAVFMLLVLGRIVPSTWGFATEFVEQNGGWDAVISEVLTRRLVRILTPVVLLVGIALAVGRLVPSRVELADDAETDDPVTGYPLATGFALMLVAGGLVLILVPEFVYLRDNFGWRMNTVFKFYYQAWVVFSIAAAYATYSLLADVRLTLPAAPVRWVYSGLLVLVLAAGLLYPIMGLYYRMFIETYRAVEADPPPLTLDGGQTLVSFDDYQAIMCLSDLVNDGDDVVVAEATGGSYDAAGRVAALTGLPIVIGWQPHEAQWRGTAYSASVGTRPSDIPQLYSDLRFDVVTSIIRRYGIDYIFFGSVERERYGRDGETKFMENLDAVCQSDSGLSTVYRVDPQALVVR